jgi:hypothetical protein
MPTVDLPDDVPQELADAAVRALIAYADTDRPGARMEILRVGDEDFDVRVQDGTDYVERVSL